MVLLLSTTLVRGLISNKPNKLAIDLIVPITSILLIEGSLFEVYIYSRSSSRTIGT